MLCTSCGYPLWNLEARSCPECGTAFKPSDFTFAVSSVRFCCPSCDQEYYGTDTVGHLVPRRFQCVRCHSEVEFDATIVRPPVGAEPEHVKVAVGAPSMPWFERERLGFWKAWFGTVKLAMISPSRLIAGIPEQTSRGAAFGFLVGHYVIYSLTGALFAMVCMGLMFGGIGRFVPGGMPTGLSGTMLLVQGASFAINTAMGIIGSIVWIWMIHALLRLFRGATKPSLRTWHCCCYSAAGGALMLVPSCGAWIGGVWWLVSAILMISATHRCSGGVATAAAVISSVVVGAVITLGNISFSLYTSGTLAAFGAAGGGFGGMTGPRSPVPSSAMAYWFDNDAWPQHGLELTDYGVVPSSFQSPGDRRATQQKLATGLTLGQLGGDQDALDAAIEAELLALPDDAIAHRVGSFVFCWHGVDPVDPAPGLWLMLHLPEPGAIGAPAVVVLSADGNERQFPMTDWALELNAQNALRAAEGLPPLPATLREDEQTVWRSGASRP